MEIRRRNDDDLDACVALAAAIRARDGYPVYLASDFHSFLAESDALAGWVASEGQRILGHVALHPRSSSPVMALVAEVTRHRIERFGVVARLMVSPEARGAGLARSLLETATAHALAVGRLPMLDVTTHSAAAIALYDAAGWRRVGQVSVPFPGGSVDEYVYLGPVGPADLETRWSNGAGRECGRR